jgi:uncharacterized protein YbjT (DUF2867 family)
LIAQLIARGHDVTAAVRKGSTARIPPGSTAVIGDALDVSTFADALPRGAKR